MTVDQAEGPLAGLLVADFSRILAGPYATMLLADMGAEVVKVEGPGGDPMRRGEGPFNGCQRGKRSVALDLKDEHDRSHHVGRPGDQPSHAERDALGALQGQRLGRDLAGDEHDQ